MEAPHLEKVHQAAKRQGGSVLGVALKGDTNKAQWQFRQRNKTTYPLAIDRSGKLGARVAGIPYTVLVDSKGVIRYINPTPDEAATEKLKSHYLKMLSAKR